MDAKGSINQWTIVGRVGRDPQLRHTASGTAVANFSVATTNRISADREETEWHNVVAWGKSAEFVGKYIKKGNRVVVVGRSATRSWEDKDGQKRYATECVANSVQSLESKGSDSADNGQHGSSASNDSDPDPSGDASDADDDLPF